MTPLTGTQLAAISDADLVEAVEETYVFARVTPEQKLRLVNALQSRGHVVAMTGDGVNDAPALRQADIGVAMGITGTEVAKEAADMILTDDNFASIEAAVEEGRGVFDNLTKFIAWTLPTNLGEGLVILAAIFAGVALPILPVQILWINMTTAVLLGLMLAFEPKEDGIMLRPPRAPKAPILDRVLIGRIGHRGGAAAGRLVRSLRVRSADRAQPGRSPHGRGQRLRVRGDVLPVQLPVAHVAVVEGEPADQPLPARRRGSHAGPAAALHLPARHEPAVRHRAHLARRPGRWMIGAGVGDTRDRGDREMGPAPDSADPAGL